MSLFLEESEKGEKINEKDACNGIDSTVNESAPTNEPCAVEPHNEEEVAIGAEESAPCAEEADAESSEKSAPCLQGEKTPAKEPKGASFMQFVYDTIELIAVSLVAVMVILTVFARHSPVNGSSMYPTILGRSEGSAVETVGEDTLLISNFLYTPQKGDIVVVQSPTIKGESNVALSLGHPIVKRIIATEHDRVSIDFINWRIEINGEKYEAGFGAADYVNYDGALSPDGTPTKPMVGFYPSVVESLKNDERCDFRQDGSLFTFTVPEGQIFILGDNRNNSKDSRAIGLIDERWIIGKSIIRIYPFDRIGVVE